MLAVEREVAILKTDFRDKDTDVKREITGINEALVTSSISLAKIETALEAKEKSDNTRFDSQSQDIKDLFTLIREMAAQLVRIVAVVTVVGVIASIVAPWILSHF